MRLLIILALIVAVFAFMGWVSFNSNGQQATVTVETRKMEADAERLVEKGEQAIESAAEAVKEGVEDLGERDKPQAGPADEKEPHPDPGRDL